MREGGSGLPGGGEGGRVAGAGGLPAAGDCGAGRGGAGIAGGEQQPAELEACKVWEGMGRRRGHTTAVRRS